MLSIYQTRPTAMPTDDAASSEHFFRRFSGRTDPHKFSRHTTHDSDGPLLHSPLHSSRIPSSFRTSQRVLACGLWAVQTAWWWSCFRFLDDGPKKKMFPLGRRASKHFFPAGAFRHANGRAAHTRRRANVQQTFPSEHITAGVGAKFLNRVVVFLCAEETRVALCSRAHPRWVLQKKMVEGSSRKTRAPPYASTLKFDIAGGQSRAPCYSLLDRHGRVPI